MDRRDFLALAAASTLPATAAPQSESFPWPIRPGEGVGPLDFDMPRRKVCRRMGTKPLPNPLGPYAPDYWEDYPAHGVRIHLRQPEERLCAVAFAGPGTPSLDGRDLLQLTCDALIDAFREADPHLAIDSGGWTSMRMGISVHAPDWQLALGAKPRGILVFAEGFFTEHIE